MFFSFLSDFSYTRLCSYPRMYSPPIVTRYTYYTCYALLVKRFGGNFYFRSCTYSSFMLADRTLTRPRSSFKCTSSPYVERKTTSRFFESNLSIVLIVCCSSTIPLFIYSPRRNEKKAHSMSKSTITKPYANINYA